MHAWLASLSDGPLACRPNATRTFVRLFAPPAGACLAMCLPEATLRPLACLLAHARAGKDGDESEEDTYDMLRKLVQLQRMTGQQQANGAAQVGRAAPPSASWRLWSLAYGN